jgi:GNAT superfamily N-acetyltransferase
VATVNLEIVAVDWEDPDADLLRARQREELVALYDGDSEPGPKPTGADVAVFLLGRDPATGEPLACGGLRPLGPRTAELKRMFVVPHARGRGLSRLLLTALEQAAADHGWTVLRLETGPRQTEALALYTGAGYRRIENFGHYAGAADSLCFEKTLTAAGGLNPRGTG